jgi:hypothetical protein
MTTDELDDGGDDLTPAVFLSKNLEEQLRLIPTMLSYIPEAFKSKRFDTLRMVLAILSSPNPREAIQELESSIEMVDLTMKTVVNGKQGYI